MVLQGVSGNWGRVVCSISLAMAYWQITGLQPTAETATPRPEAASKSHVQGIPSEKDGGLAHFCAQPCNEEPCLRIATSRDQKQRAWTT